MATLINKDPVICQCCISPVYHSPMCTYGQFSNIDREDIKSDFDIKNFEFKVPEQGEGQVITEIHMADHTDYMTCKVPACPECRQESARAHDHTKFMPNATSKKFHGIMQVSEEMILAGLGIYDENVQIKRIETPFGKNCIQIHITAPESDVDMGDGSILKLYKVTEGAEVPVVVPEEDGEQIDNLHRDPPAGVMLQRITGIGGV